MSGYHRLTQAQRYQISVLKETEISMREIARLLSVSPSTISRELSRNAGAYCAKRAQQASISRRCGVGPRRKIIGSVKRQIDKLLSLQWSPIQICKEPNIKVSHETIYRYVYRQYLEAREQKLYLNLRRKRRWRRSRGKLKNQSGCGVRADRVSIWERPKIVEKRSRVGDFERDLILGKNGRLITIVDRTSRLVKIGKIKRSTAAEAHQATIDLLRGLVVHTITNDHGHEFSFHKETSEKLNAKVYFADPHCPWQRGTNENTNGLIRQYFPKGTDFSAVKKKDIKKIEKLLNNRPRKTLGFRTPNEVHRELSQGVALST